MGREEKSVEREMNVHGSRWSTFHEGYFSDPAVARPLVDAICRAMKRSSPTVVADLGGGTGFVLHQVLTQSPCEGVRAEDVDISPRQLAEERDPRITDLPLSVAEVTREKLCPRKDDRLMLVMRSVLHYFGRKGSSDLLGHLREQMRRGELFVHQSACFRHHREAECLNQLYRQMRTRKRYPTLDEMERVLSERGWALTEVTPAPAIHLTSQDLAARYSLSTAQVGAIRDALAAKYGPIPDVLALESEGFSAWLHYHIFTCTAV